MRLVVTAAMSAAVLGLAACTTVTTSEGPASPAPSASSAARSPSGATPTPAPSTAPTTQPAAPTGAPASVAPNVTDPWAVVSAYYGDIESGAYAQAWALLNSGATTGQTYQ
jgi:hypothetical protein